MVKIVKKYMKIPIFYIFIWFLNAYICSCTMPHTIPIRNNLNNYYKTL